MIVDGNDILAVYEATETAIARARKGEGPTLIECKTYRWRGHTERVGGSDPRPEEEVKAWKQKDPIERFVAGLMDRGALNQEEWQKMENIWKF